LAALLIAALASPLALPNYLAEAAFFFAAAASSAFAFSAA
jgi:hypothetical protein